jgi:hypothetical protein
MEVSQVFVIFSIEAITNVQYLNISGHVAKKYAFLSLNRYLYQIFTKPFSLVVQRVAQKS